MDKKIFFVKHCAIGINAPIWNNSTTIFIKPTRREIFKKYKMDCQITYLLFDEEIIKTLTFIRESEYVECHLKLQFDQQARFSEVIIWPFQISIKFDLLSIDLLFVQIIIQFRQSWPTDWTSKQTLSCWQIEMVTKVVS